jgi:hypothetical protein
MPHRSEDKVAVTPASDAHLATYADASRQVQAFATPRLYDAEDPRARVFYALFDGTSNDAIKDPEHITNVGLLARQVERLAQADPHIGVFYKEGPGTQRGLTGLVDAAIGGTYAERIEVMYDQFAKQSARWLRDDPQAQISVVSVGFSRGAEQAAGFARMVDERGVQDMAAAVRDSRPFGPDRLTFTAPPLRAPGQVAQALGLYDPVGTGAPAQNDRRPPPSVLTGLQIYADHEFRRQFPATTIIPEGTSENGRFLGVTTAGAHSDIGGGYKLNGLSHRNFNMMADYLNNVMGEAVIRPLAVPAEPSMSVIHDTPWYFIKREEREIITALDKNGLPREQVNPVLAELFDKQRVPLTVATPAPALVAVLSLDNTRTAAFEDLGRNTEVAQVLTEAALKIRAGDPGPFPLHDTNGNAVGRFAIVTDAPTAPPPDGAVRLALDLNQPIFGGDREHRLAQTILQAAEQVAASGNDVSFALKSPDGQVLGDMVMQRHIPAPAPEAARNLGQGPGF